ncbi:MAG: GyrI-like domain-containing protein [Chitinophagaceae bacterium]|nr:GyrI-like domain-containing protein [Chitinophagaceae bacterium]
MEIKTHPTMTVLYSTHQTTISGLSQFVGTVVKELFTEAVSNDVLVSGPVYWVYHGMDGQPDTVFTLEIAIPIQGVIKSSRFATKELPAFKTASHVHENGWTKIPATYAQIMQFIAMNSLQMTGECREIYWNIDFENPENNLTEIQVGVVLNGLQREKDLINRLSHSPAALTY